MPLPRDDRFWSRVVRIAAAVGLILGTGTLIVVYITMQRFETQMKERGGGELIEAALAVERRTMTVILMLLVGVIALNLYAATRSGN